jgi:ribosomal-protein-alanine N-acetyltransferase
MEVEKEAAVLGAEKLVLHTGVDNASAQALFQRHGFRVLETRREFYPAGQDALTLVKEL